MPNTKGGSPRSRSTAPYWPGTFRHGPSDWCAGGRKLHSHELQTNWERALLHEPLPPLEITEVSVAQDGELLPEVAHDPQLARVRTRCRTRRSGLGARRPVALVRTPH